MLLVASGLTDTLLTLPPGSDPRASDSTFTLRWETTSDAITGGCPLGKLANTFAGDGRPACCVLAPRASLCFVSMGTNAARAVVLDRPHRRSRQHAPSSHLHPALLAPILSLGAWLVCSNVKPDVLLGSALSPFQQRGRPRPHVRRPRPLSRLFPVPAPAGTISNRDSSDTESIVTVTDADSSAVPTGGLLPYNEDSLICKSDGTSQYDSKSIFCCDLDYEGIHAACALDKDTCTGTSDNILCSTAGPCTCDTSDCASMLCGGGPSMGGYQYSTCTKQGRSSAYCCSA
jgi:hypothetical protein